MVSGIHLGLDGSDCTNYFDSDDAEMNNFRTESSLASSVTQSSSIGLALLNYDTDKPFETHIN